MDIQDNENNNDYTDDESVVIISDCDNSDCDSLDENDSNIDDNKKNSLIEEFCQYQLIYFKDDEGTIWFTCKKQKWCRTLPSELLDTLDTLISKIFTYSGDILISGKRQYEYYKLNDYLLKKNHDFSINLSDFPDMNPDTLQYEISNSGVPWSYFLGNLYFYKTAVESKIFKKKTLNGFNLNNYPHNPDISVPERCGYVSFESIHKWISSPDSKNNELAYIYRERFGMPNYDLPIGKQKAVSTSKFIIENFSKYGISLQDMMFDQKAKNTNKRPDLILTISEEISIVFEYDEKDHRNYPERNEIDRENELRINSNVQIIVRHDPESDVFDQWLKSDVYQTVHGAIIKKMYDSEDINAKIKYFEALLNCTEPGLIKVLESLIPILFSNNVNSNYNQKNHVFTLENQEWFGNIIKQMELEQLRDVKNLTEEIFNDMNLNDRIELIINKSRMISNNSFIKSCDANGNYTINLNRNAMLGIMSRIESIESERFQHLAYEILSEIDHILGSMKFYTNKIAEHQKKLSKYNDDHFKRSNELHEMEKEIKKYKRYEKENQLLRQKNHDNEETLGNVTRKCKRLEEENKLLKQKKS